MHKIKISFKNMPDIPPADTIRMLRSRFGTLVHRYEEPSHLKIGRKRIVLPNGTDVLPHAAVAAAARPQTPSGPVGEIACATYGESLIHRMDPTGNPLMTLRMRGQPVCLKYDQSGAILAAGGEKGELCVWNVADRLSFRPEVWLVGTELRQQFVMDIAFCNSRSIFVLTKDGRVHLVRRPAKAVLDANNNSDGMISDQAPIGFNQDDDHDLVGRLAADNEMLNSRPQVVVSDQVGYSICTQSKETSCVDLAFASSNCIHFLRYNRPSGNKVWRLITHLSQPIQMEFSGDLLILTGYQGCEIYWIGTKTPQMIASKYLTTRRARGTAVLDRIGNWVSIGIFSLQPPPDTD